MYSKKGLSFRETLPLSISCTGERAAVLSRGEAGKGDGQPGRPEAGGGHEGLGDPRQAELQLSHPRPRGPAQVHRPHHVHSDTGIYLPYSIELLTLRVLIRLIHFCVFCRPNPDPQREC